MCYPPTLVQRFGVPISNVDVVRVIGKAPGAAYEAVSRTCLLAIGSRKASHFMFGKESNDVDEM